MILFAFAAIAADTLAIIVLCAAMTIAFLWYVFHAPAVAFEEKTRLAYLRERKEVVYENLRDLNFEYRAGKFPENDYQQMRNALEEEAAALLAEIEAGENAAPASSGMRKPGSPAAKGVRS